jgi:hypothetical protein
VNQHIEDAKKFYEKAKRGFEEAVRTGDMIKLRNSVEKVWNAVVRATDGLFVKKRTAQTKKSF